MRAILHSFARAVTAVCAAALATTALHAQDKPAAPESTTRGGLPNFFAKLKAGEEVRVGYLGGSITAAPGWRVKSLKWLQEQYPNAKLSEINAAIGGTGSDLGAFRANQDVISKKPDLLFIEFAVNDGGTAPDRIHRQMEGIVRQTWKADPNTDICFVYTLSEPMLKDLQEGRYQTSAKAMEDIANHYSIPSIHFGPEVAKRVTDGTLIFKAPKPEAGATGPMVFSSDGVHPHTDTGHVVYQEVLARSLTSMKDAGTGGPHKLAAIAPFREDNWENAKIVPITESMLKGKWTKLDPNQPGRAKDFKNRMPEMWKAEEPGASLEFIVEGTVARAYDLLGPDGCELEIQVGEQPPTKALRFDMHSVYHRLGSLHLYSSPTADRQLIKVTLTGNMPDKAKIVSAGNRPKMEKNSEAYKKAVWHVGSLLIIGDVAD